MKGWRGGEDQNIYKVCECVCVCACMCVCACVCVCVQTTYTNMIMITTAKATIRKMATMTPPAMAGVKSVGAGEGEMQDSGHEKRQME